MRRSDSAKTSLSVIVARTSKYQRLLASINVLLMIVSLAIVFSGYVLVTQYQMDKLGFLSDYFFLLPWMLIIVGTLTFLVSLSGFILTGVETRKVHMAYATFMALLLLAMIAIVFIGLEVRTMVRDKELINFNSQQVAIQMLHEPTASSFRAKWDSLHQNLRYYYFA